MPFDDDSNRRQEAPDRVLVVLEFIRSGVEQGRWCKGRLDDGDRHCLVGWVGFVAPPQVNPMAPLNGLWMDTMEALAEHLASPIQALPYYHGADKLVHFNDQQSTTREDVLKLIDAAIARRSNGASP